MKNVRVFCPVCKGGHNAIWEGTLLEWGKELEKETPPEWANYGYRHEKAHPGHKIMVEYPSGMIAPFRIGEMIDLRGE